MKKEHGITQSMEEDTFQNIDYQREIERLLVLRGNPTKNENIVSELLESSANFESFDEFIKSLNVGLIAAFELAVADYNYDSSKPLDEQLLPPSAMAILQVMMSVEIARQKGLFSQEQV